MAMGPLDADRPWHTDDIVGVYRFLQRLWRSMVDEQTGDLIVGEAVGEAGGAAGGNAGYDGKLDEQTSRLLHRTIRAVAEHYAGLRFNIVIARLQELLTHAARVAAAQGVLPRALAEPLLLMVAPLAPHVAEELWARLGHGESIAHAAFPEADPALAAESTLVLPVQIDGKTRLRIEVPADADEERITQILTAHPDVARYVGPAGIDRLVVVPGRIANIVTR
jgi:leucyl-tRNA synthetase